MKNSRKIILIFASLLIWQILPLKGQPFSDRQIRLKPVHYKLDIKIDYDNERLIGKCRLTITNQTAGPVQRVPLILYRLMRVTSINDENGKALTFKQQVFSYEDFEALQVNFIEVSLQKPLEKDEQQTILIDYEGKLLGYAETGMSYVQDRIDPEFTIIRPDCRAYPMIGVPNYAVNRRAGLPEFDYEVSVNIPDSLTAANPGILVEKKVSTGRVIYSYKSKKPSWRIDIAIAKYGTIDQNGQRIFYLREDSLRAIKIMDLLRETMDLYSSWFGPQHGSTGLTLIEIPDGFGSQTIQGCIIQTSAAFRNDKLLYEFYHEVSHLWNVSETDPYPIRWQEGLAMFLQYLTIEKLEHRPALDNASSAMLSRLARTYRDNPRFLDLPMSDLGKSNATQFSYTAGMLFFNTLYSLIGEEQFLNTISSFYQKYYVNGATVEEFIYHMQENTTIDLGKFFNEWFYKPIYSHYINRGLTMDEIIEQYR